MTVATRLFPEVYMNGDRPARRGVTDKTRLSLPTPAYGFGWILPSVELFQTLEINDEEPPLKVWLLQLPKFVAGRVYPRWKIKGYDYRYNPARPQARRIGEDHILILMACNDETEVMDRVVDDKAYHEECRDCLNNPKTMRQEPAWFRVGLRGMPKDFIPVVDPNEALTG